MPIHRAIKTETIGDDPRRIREPNERTPREEAINTESQRVLPRDFFVDFELDGFDDPVYEPIDDSDNDVDPDWNWDIPHDMT